MLGGLSQGMVVAKKLLLQACLNGYRTRAEHERIPLAPDELAADARAAEGAGAESLHIHPRADDGSESLEPTDVGAAVDIIRRACPGLPIGVTTGGWIEPHPNRLETIRSWNILPDFASVNFSEPGAAELARLLLDRGIGVEAGVAQLEDAGALAASGVAGDCLRVLVEVIDEPPRAAVAAAQAIDAELTRNQITVTRLHHGTDLATWSVLEAAIRRGHDIRVGLEDTLVMPDGSPAPDNAQLVEVAATMIDEESRPNGSRP